MKLKDGYCHQTHLTWLRWRPWFITIHRDPADSGWEAWTCRYRYAAWGDSSEKALENIKRKIKKRK